MADLRRRLSELERTFSELTASLADPEVLSDSSRYKAVSKRRANLEEVVGVYRSYRRVLDDAEAARELVKEATGEDRELLRAEADELSEQAGALEQRLQILLLPRDPLDDKGVMVEIRAGAGGDEAGLFAGQLYRMYSRYAERKGWRAEPMSVSEQGIGGLKEVIFSVRGRGAYSKLKHESGVHRVQRVPVTESGGRIHTSTASVAVMPEA
ncbi:MAG: PCRF domain-containing protein, partial [Geminicoccales bacterium]